MGYEFREQVREELKEIKSMLAYLIDREMRFDKDNEETKSKVKIEKKNE